MFADYRVPQVLRSYKVLEYSPQLSKDIDEKVEIPYGSQGEIEIRACTIVAVEMLGELLGKLGKPFKTVEIDWMLWQMGEARLDSLAPHHRTRTIFY